MRTSRTTYKPYPRDVSDEEWSFVVPYLPLNRLDGENRKHDLRAEQKLTGKSVELAYVDQGYTGETAHQAAQTKGVKLEMVKHRGQARLHAVAAPLGGRTQLRLGDVLPLSGARLRLAQTLAGLHYLAFACLMLHRLIPFVNANP